MHVHGFLARMCLSKQFDFCCIFEAKEKLSFFYFAIFYVGFSWIAELNYAGLTGSYLIVQITPSISMPIWDCYSPSNSTPERICRWFSYMDGEGGGRGGYPLAKIFRRTITETSWLFLQLFFVDAPMSPWLLLVPNNAMRGLTQMSLKFMWPCHYTAKFSDPFGILRVSYCWSMSKFLKLMTHVLKLYLPSPQVGVRIQTTLHQN